MYSTIGMAVVISATSMGFGGHHERKAGCCDECGIETAEVARDVSILQHSARWRERDNAAHRLAKYDWKCHPQIVHVLVTAMLHDCKDDVRDESAESLKKLKPRLPEVHVALTKAANCDPDFCVRHQARKALKALGKSCDGPCSACGTESVVEVGPSYDVPVGEPILIPPTEITPGEPLPGNVLPPPADLPSPLPGSAPFVPGMDSSRKDKDRTIAAKEREASNRPDRPLLLGRRLRIGPGR